MPYSHGEKVAFGVGTDLCLDEDIAPAERLAAFDFMVTPGWLILRLNGTSHGAVVGPTPAPGLAVNSMDNIPW